MPLAYPTSNGETTNFGHRMLVIELTTGRPGEDPAEFKKRALNPPRTQWGMRSDRESRTELIFDRAAAERLAGILSEYLSS